MNDSIPIDVFIDLESFGFGVKRSEGRHVNKLGKYLENLLRSLRNQGYAPQQVIGFACYAENRRQVIPTELRLMVRNIFHLRGAQMFWGQFIADELLYAVVRSRKKMKVLQKTVFLLTNDGDFSGLVRELKEEQYTVVCSGPAMSKKLKRSANSAVPFSKLCPKRYR